MHTSIRKIWRGGLVGTSRSQPVVCRRQGSTTHRNHSQRTQTPSGTKTASTAHIQRTADSTPSLNMPELTGDPKQYSPSKLNEGMTGSCLCGSITVHILEKGLFDKPRGHLCYCSNCRKVAGSYVASNMLISSDDVKIEDRDGTLKTYVDKASASGNAVYRSFCSVDGNPVKSETAAYPGKLVLKMGMFPRIPKPEAEGFGLHKQDWTAKHDGVPTYKVKWAGPEKQEMES